MKSEVLKWWHNRKLYSCIIFFLLIHILIKETSGDSVNVFSHALDNQFFTEYILTRYQSWSSRVLIDLILPFLSNHIYVWKVLNMGMCMLLLWGLVYLSHGKANGLAAGLLLLYPFTDMRTAGWIATCVNYLWPLALMTVSCVGLDKAYHGKKMNLLEIEIYLFCEIFATNMEQVCGLYICVVGYTLVLFIIQKKHSGLRFVIFQFLIAAANLIFILTCPGNYARKVSEVTSHMKDYGTMSIVDKLVIGINSTVQFLVNHSLLFFVFCVVLFVFSYQESKVKKDKWLCVTSAIPMLFVVFCTILKPVVSIYYPNFYGLFGNANRVTAGNYIYYTSYIPTIIFTIIIMMIILSLFNLADEVEKGTELVFIFVVGLSTRVVMGFSPTLYASSRRTFLFLILALIFVILRIYEYKSADIEGNERLKAFLQYGLVILDVFSVMENIIAIC